ncbi:MAG: metallophosphoesterase [Balneolaceae bacterium]|nr:metallophosphoesterase [Balneolaceae bacterium]MCH8547712.1 metallophosphoesterase [Balneolaceae bacterium]
MIGRILTTIFILILTTATIAEAQNPERGDIRIVVIADMNESYGSTHYDLYVDSSLYWIDRWQPDAILTGGDHIAGQSLDLEEETIYAMWEAFDEVIAQPIYDMGIPFGVTMGNHDASGSGSFDHERDIAEEYFTQSPTHLNFQNNDHFPFYFSFTVEDLFVISWDASAHQISTEEREWVADQLSSDKARDASYRILIGHLPLYAVAEGRNRYGEILEDADELFELLKENGLDIYISGHHHAYYPAKKEGVLLLSAGAIGSGPRPLIGSDLPPRRTITLIDFFEDSENYVITTYDLENEMEEILPEELPESIEGINGVLHRYDLAKP